MIYESILHFENKDIGKRIQQRMNALHLDIYDLYNLLYPDDLIDKKDFSKIGDKQHYRDKVRTLDNWIKGKAQPKSIQTYIDICIALECDTNYLLLGNTCTTQTKQDMQDVLGLTESAIDTLTEWKNNGKNDRCATLSTMLENNYSCSRLLDALDKELMYYSSHYVELIKLLLILGCSPESICDYFAHDYNTDYLLPRINSSKYEKIIQFINSPHFTDATNIVYGLEHHTNTTYNTLLSDIKANIIKDTAHSAKTSL